MAVSLSHSLPYPIQNARFSFGLSFRTSAGTPTDPTTPDTEFSTDGGATFADCAEEIATGGANGMGYITLTGAETNNKLVEIAAKSANCVTTPAVLHCRNLPTIGSGTLSAGSSGGGTLGTLLAYDVTNCFIRTTGGTGGGGTGGANNQARRILTYNTSTGAFTVATWETTPDATTTYDVLLPEGVTLGMLRTLNPATPGRTAVVDAAGLIDANTVKLGPTGSGTAQTARDIGLSVLLSVGTGTGQVNLASGKIPATVATTDAADLTTLLARLTSTRAGYLDNLTNLDAAISSLNNLSALCNLYGSPLLEIPDSSTTQFAFTLVTRDSEGKLVDLDSSPTLAAANAAGTDRSANLSAVTHAATGRYTFTYGVTSSAAEESLRITVSGTVSAEARYIEWVGAVVNYDSLTTIAAIKAKTDNLPASPAAVADIPTAAAVASQVRTELTTELARIDAAVTTRATPAEVNAQADQALADYDAPTKAELDSAVALLATSAQLVKVLAAVYDSVTVAGSVLTLSNGHTQTIGAGGRTTA